VPFQSSDKSLQVFIRKHNRIQEREKRRAHEETRNQQQYDRVNRATRFESQIVLRLDESTTEKIPHWVVGIKSDCDN
jgi:hypothetical protein